LKIVRFLLCQKFIFFCITGAGDASQSKHAFIDACEAELRNTIPNYDASQPAPRVIVWHNAVARIPFPDDLFRGLFDTHFGIVQVQGEAVTQIVTYRGSCLPASVRV